MANLKLSTALRNDMLDQFTSNAGGNAILRIFNGTQPANGGAETTILAQLTCNSTFANAASAGTLLLNGITADSSASNSGTATWFRIYQSDATTQVLDGEVSTTSAGTGDLQLDNTVIQVGGTVALGGPNQIVAPNP